MARKKAEPKPPKPKINRSDWRALPYEQWNTLTVLAMVTELNREFFSIETYVPYRNSWPIERGIVKRELERYGAEAMRELFDAAFAEYKSTREYPILTAGFVITYMAGRILPRILADRDAKKRREELAEAAPSEDEIKAWL